MMSTSVRSGGQQTSSSSQQNQQQQQQQQQQQARNTAAPSGPGGPGGPSGGQNNFEAHNQDQNQQQQQQFGQGPNRPNVPLQYSQVAAAHPGFLPNPAGGLVVGSHEVAAKGQRQVVGGGQGQQPQMYSTNQQGVNVVGGQVPVPHPGHHQGVGGPQQQSGSNQPQQQLVGPPQQGSAMIGGPGGPNQGGHPGMPNRGQFNVQGGPPHMNQTQPQSQGPHQQQHAGQSGHGRQFPNQHQGNHMPRGGGPYNPRHTLVQNQQAGGQPFVFPLQAAQFAQAAGYQNAAMGAHHHHAGLHHQTPLMIPANQIHQVSLHQQQGQPRPQYHVQQPGQMYHTPQYAHPYQLQYGPGPYQFVVHGHQGQQGSQGPNPQQQPGNQVQHSNQQQARGPPLNPMQSQQPIQQQHQPQQGGGAGHAGQAGGVQSVQNESQNPQEGSRPPTGHSPAVPTMSVSAPPFQPRKKTPALLQDPNSLKAIDLNELSKQEDRGPTNGAAASGAAPTASDEILVPKAPNEVPSVSTSTSSTPVVTSSTSGDSSAQDVPKEKTAPVQSKATTVAAPAVEFMDKVTALAANSDPKGPISIISDLSAASATEPVTSAMSDTALQTNAVTPTPSSPRIAKGVLVASSNDTITNNLEPASAKESVTFKSDTALQTNAVTTSSSSKMVAEGVEVVRSSEAITNSSEPASTTEPVISAMSDTPLPTNAVTTSSSSKRIAKDVHVSKTVQVASSDEAIKNNFEPASATEPVTSAVNDTPLQTNAVTTSSTSKKIAKDVHVASSNEAVTNNVEPAKLLPAANGAPPGIQSSVSAPSPTVDNASTLEDIVDEPGTVTPEATSLFIVEDLTEDPSMYIINGKRVYSREDLYKFMLKPLSLVRPNTIDKTNILYDHPRQVPGEDRGFAGGRSGGSGERGPISDPFLPNYAHNYNQLGMSASQRGSRNSSRGHGERGGGGGGYSGRNSSSNQPKKIIIPTIQDVKLRTTENAWKADGPAVKGPKGVDIEDEDDDPEQAKTNNLLKKFRGILNKITPQKFKDLLARIDQLPIDTEDRLRQVLDLVFEKAVDEPAFCIQYANLCKHLSNTLEINKFNEETKQDEKVKFQRLLLSRCQKEFESDVYADIDIVGRQAAIDACEDAAPKKQLLAEFDEEKRQARRKSLGNIKLIGELYRLDMLKGVIMVSCMHKLISDLEEESLECLCTLLRTIGGQLEEECHNKGKTKEHLQPYFLRLGKIVEEKQTSSRIRFLIQDVVEMRTNNWVVRKIQDENKPKTIDQIHADVKKEELQKVLADHQHRSGGGKKSRDESGRNDYYGGRRSQTNQNVSSGPVDFSALKQLRESSSAGAAFSGPNFSQWGKGSGSSSQSQQQPLSARPSQDGRMTTNNRYSALSDEPSRHGGGGRDSRDSRDYRGDSRGHGQGGGGRGSQQGMGRDRDGRSDSRTAGGRPGNFISGPPRGAAFSNSRPTDSARSGRQERDSSAASDGRSSVTGSRNSSMQGSVSRDSARSPTVSGVRFTGSENTSQDDFERRAKNIVNEYNSNGLLGEVCSSVLELCTEKNAQNFVNQAITSSLEASQEIRSSVAKILNELLVKKVISWRTIAEGLVELFKIADDLVVDIPKFWEYIGQTLSLVFLAAGSERKQFVLSALKDCLGKPGAGKLVANMLKASIQFTSESDVHQAWCSSGLTWHDILGPDANVEDFVQSSNLEFTLAAPSKSSSKSSSEISDEFKESLIQTSRTGSNEAVASKIDDLYNDKTAMSPAVVSALFKLIIRGCIDTVPDPSGEKHTLNDKTLSDRCEYLATLIQGLPEVDTIELKCLFALQELMEELAHPGKVLDKIFSTLYDRAVISQEGILTWEDSAENAKGKAMAILSAKPFLTWLKENQDTDEDEREG